MSLNNMQNNFCQNLTKNRAIKGCKLAFIAFFITLSSACSHLENKSGGSGNTFKTQYQQHQLNDISKLSVKDRADLYQKIIAADLAFYKQDYGLATSYYLASAKISQSEDLIKLSINSAKKAGDILAILQSAELWLSISPDNVNARTLKISGLLLMQDLLPALEETSVLLKSETDENDRFLLFDEISDSQSPRVLNVYFARLSQVYKHSPSIQAAWANYMSRYALKSKSPSSVYAQALTIVDSALEIKGDFLPAIDIKTRIYYQTKQDALAEAFLRDTLLKYPDSKETSLLLGQLLYDLKKYPLAENQYKSLINQYKNNDEARFYLGAIYFATHRYKESLEQYRKLLGSTYKTQTSYFFCGSSAAQLKDYPQAIACYDLVSSGPYLTRSKVELAKLYALNEDYDKALSVVREPKYKTDENSIIQFLNIEIEIIKKQVGDLSAKKLLEDSLKIYPTSIPLLLHKIKFESLSDQPEQLKAIFSNALINSKKDTGKTLSDKKLEKFNLTVAAFFQANQHYQYAVDWLTHALINDKENTEYIYTRALYKEPLGLLDEMVADFKKLLKLQPNNINIKNALGYTLVDINKELDYASGLIEAAFIEMPSNAAVIDSKGWLAYRKGYLKQAIKYLSASFRLSPSAEVATHLAEVYWKMEDKDNAKFYFKKAEALQPNNYLLRKTKKRLGVPSLINNAVENGSH